MSVALRALLRKSSALAQCRNIHATSSALMYSNEFQKNMFKWSGYHKYGLLHDDLVNEMDVDVIEALRRLPDDLLMKRLHRSIRAQVLEANHTLLPKEEWTNMDDEGHFYLQPYLQEVIAEREERELWEANN